MAGSGRAPRRHGADGLVCLGSRRGSRVTETWGRKRRKVCRMQCVLIIAVVHFLLARICLKVITAYVCVCIGVSLRKTCNQTITVPIALCLCASAYSVR